MNRIFFCLACLTVACSVIAADSAAPATSPSAAYKPKLDKDGWEILFDGHDLDAFDAPTDGSWVVTPEGELHVAKDGQNLYTKKRYCDFVVECDFKLGGHARANSGILLRVHDQADPVNTGMEIQVLDNADYDVAYNAYNACGALYDMVPPPIDATKPIGQWNHYKITVNDNIVQVELNGKAIVDADLNRWTTPHKNPDGTKNKYPYAIGNLPREGFLGLQNYSGTPVWFRNVRIKPLTDRQPKYTGQEPIKDVLPQSEIEPTK